MTASTKQRSISREYLEEALAVARKLLPGWAYASVRRAALPRSGGRAKARDDEPSTLEKLALADIQPSKIKAIGDVDLKAMWRVLGKWHAAAVKRKRPVDEIVSAARWVIAEMDNRGLDEKPSPLTEAAALKKQDGDDIADAMPSHGPVGAPVAFVGASPGRIETARGQPLTGPAGETFRDQYLKPLGLKYDDVAKLNAVPVFLADDQGRARQPTEEEVAEWSGRLGDELNRLKPKLIIALGRVAKDALGNRADYVLPHPSAVRRFGDSGEVARKLKAVRRAIKKSQPAGGDVHVDAPMGNQKAKKKKPKKTKANDPAAWGDTWHEQIEGVNKLDELISIFKGDGSLQYGALPASRAGATFQLGVAKRDEVEFFLDNEGQKCRYLIKLSSESGRDHWLIDKPADQTPTVERQDLGDTIAELKRKGQQYLFWGKPGERSRKINVQTGKEAAVKLIPISKADKEKRIVYGVVLDPYQVDTDGDWCPPGAIEDTAHEWMRKSRVIGMDHEDVADAYPVESSIFQYPSKADYQKALKGQAHRAYRMPFGNDVVHSGAWIAATKLGPKEWALYQDGEIDAYSIGGYGHRTEIQRQTMPEVEFVDLASDQTP